MAPWSTASAINNSGRLCGSPNQTSGIQCPVSDERFLPPLPRASNCKQGSPTGETAVRAKVHAERLDHLDGQSRASIGSISAGKRNWTRCSSDRQNVAGKGATGPRPDGVVGPHRSGDERSSTSPDGRQMTNPLPSRYLRNYPKRGLTLSGEGQTPFRTGS